MAVPFRRNIQKVVNVLYSSWLSYVERLAESGIFFDEISSMVGSRAGNDSLKKIGMNAYAEYIAGGTMYKYSFQKGEISPYLVKNYPRLSELYSSEYKDC